MELTYEETMRRINKYEKDDPTNYKYCREKQFPYHVDIYKGEGQLVIVPLITSIGWYSTEMAWYCQITETENEKLIGETIFEALEHIKASPVDARTRPERKEDYFRFKISKYKSYTTFNKNYLLAGVIYKEDGTYVISQTKRLAGNKGYGGDDSTRIFLPATATAEDIGTALVKSFAEMEEFYGKAPKKVEPPRTTFETISGAKISFVAPSDEVYTDEEDYHTAEIYQGYSYRKEDAEESVADMYFSIAAELDCDTTPEHMQNVYEEFDGEAQSFECTTADHPVFEQRIEVESAKIHRIVYLKTMDESELLACELVIKKKLAGKRLHDKIVKDFEKMVKTCREEK